LNLSTYFYIHILFSCSLSHFSIFPFSQFLSFPFYKPSKLLNLS
jgi:hypothetical protein